MEGAAQSKFIRQVRHDDLIAACHVAETCLAFIPVAGSLCRSSKFPSGRHQDQIRSFQFSLAIAEIRSNRSATSWLPKGVSLHPADDLSLLHALRAGSSTLVPVNRHARWYER